MRTKSYEMRSWKLKIFLISILIDLMTPSSESETGLLPSVLRTRIAVGVSGLVVPGIVEEASCSR